MDQTASRVVYEFGDFCVDATQRLLRARAEAMNLVEELLAATPGPGPAHIARDPFLTVPLAKNERYRALVERLEAQMRSTKL